MDKPDSVNIFGITYSIKYFDNPSEVDGKNRKAYWGQCDYWEREIRIYSGNRPIEDIWGTIIHEVLHGLEEALHLKCFEDGNGDEVDELDTLANALADTLIRNGWLK